MKNNKGYIVEGPTENTIAPSQLKNGNVPKPPKPGEIMYCQFCGKPMLPKDFSKNPIIRKREFKWQIHYACQEKMSALCDINTPGVIAERKQKQIDN